MQINEILAQTGGLQSIARELGISEAGQRQTMIHRCSPPTRGRS